MISNRICLSHLDLDKGTEKILTLRGQASLVSFSGSLFTKMSPPPLPPPCRIVDTVVYAILRPGLPFKQWVKNSFSKKNSLVPEIEPHQVDISPSLDHWSL